MNNVTYERYSSILIDIYRAGYEGLDSHSLPHSAVREMLEMGEIGRCGGTCVHILKKGVAAVGYYLALGLVGEAQQ